MKLNDIIIKAKKGKLIKLPNFEGIFKWNYSLDELWFYNNGYSCKATDLNISNRTDFYYIT